MEQFDTSGFDSVSRTRILESKHNDLRERVLIVNQNMVQGYKNMSMEIKAIHDDVKEIKKEIFELKEVINKIVHDLAFFANKNDLKVLEKYINMWNPLNFVTEKEVIELVKNKRGDKSSRKKGK